MHKDSMLYPQRNQKRSDTILDGLWKFSFDPASCGEKEGWPNGLPSFVKMPVPASFQEMFTDIQSREYCGDYWYETDFYLDEKKENTDTVIRFGSVTHRCKVFLNGKLVGQHEGGFLPFNVDINDAAKYDDENKLVLLVNNELSEEMLPCGATEVKPDGRKVAHGYFDFFNYSGIHRSVHLLTLPAERIDNYAVSFTLEENRAVVHCTVETESNAHVVIALKQDGKAAAQEQGKECDLIVENPHLWDTKDPYLYEIELQLVKDNEVLDLYRDKIGIRTIAVKGTKILLNNKPVYLKGYGKHEDASMFGRGFNYAIAARDFACMKWNGANCFRTSHYPYDEKWYQMADEQGFLIIDEVPAVGMMRSMHNYVAAGSGGKYTGFFESETVPRLKKRHLEAVKDMIRRDQNHPSVIAWSLFNEPETTSTYAHAYFKDVFDYAKKIDQQVRPCTGAFEKNSKPELCQCYMLVDFMCFNRYYGWYISGGDLKEAEEKFRDELSRWRAKNLNIPFVFTEFGCDTLGDVHELPGRMWSQEYQREYYEMYFKVFRDYPEIQGELVWNFADFMTGQAIMRVGGNRKGVFTRDRQPKDAAYILKQHWESIE